MSASSPHLSTGSIGQVIMAAVARFPERPALADGRVSWTYRDFAAAMERATAVFVALGLKKGDGLAMLSGNRVEQVACQYAAMLIGLRYTALHPLAAKASHVFILRDAEISALIVDSAVMPGDIGFTSELPQLRHVLSFGSLVGATDILPLMSEAAPRMLEDNADPDSVAYLFYTGGTTGQPKGVVLPHRSIVMATVLQAADWDLPSDDVRFLAMTPTSHASGIIVPTVFLRGGYVRLAREFDPQRFCEIVAQEKINMTFLVPTMLYVLLDHPSLRQHDLSSLRTIMYGAAPMSADRLKGGMEQFGPVFVQLYGQTEVPMCISTLRKVDHDPARADRIASCGLPVPSMQVKLFDPHMREVGVNEPGEICVRGPLVMDGYWKRPEATEEAFKGGWLHTGDVAKRSADGYLTIVDRTKDMIISGGFNVFPREVEDALLAHPDVANAAVIGVPHAKWGEAVVAYVARRKGATVDEAALKAHVKTVRGAIWSPKNVLFVDSIPVTAIGKIDRKALRVQYTAREQV
jgi:fatty-acyl-CoA synthase